MSAPRQPRHFLFLATSTRQSPEDGGHLGNTEWLARQAAATLPAGTTQTWHHLSRMTLPAFVDQRHTTGQYAMPVGDLKTLLAATLAATDLVLVAPVYWYSMPAPLKTYIDHWSAWMRIPGVPFKDEMAKKTLRLVTTSGDRAKAQPMMDSVKLCAQFLSMTYGGELWGKGGPPDAVKADAAAVAQAATFLNSPS
ncbi:NAD(P)H-dependent oxidoreductase [Polaromonas sp.]|uniref:NAD(P)H-dependent oxidoreductase n=1 Tax=Polaromonas sp. TaxID=1869339 RepID=UPI002FCB4258